MARLFDKCLLSACAALAFTAVSADVSDDFEGTTTSWTGNATITEGTYDYTKAVGLPLTESATQTHTKYLEVAGQAVRTYGTDDATSGETVTVDMMVKVTAADELPDAPEDTSDIQVAVAAGPLASTTDTAAPLYVYSKAEDASEYAWNSTGKSYTVNSWVRLMLVMDYDKSQCKVTVDGDVIATVAYVGKPATEKKVSSLTVEGSTALDDVVVKAYSDSSATDVTPFPADAKSDTAKVGDEGSEVYVKMNWLYKNGIDGSKENVMSTPCEDKSGMTYAQKYEAGLDIDDGKKFEVTSMSVTDANTAAFTLPGKADSYEVVIDSDGTTTKVTPTTSTASGVTTATVDLKSVTGKVIKFTVKAKATKAE